MDRGVYPVIVLLFLVLGYFGTEIYRQGPLAFSFWSINVGLALMVLLSVLPVGLL